MVEEIFVGKIPGKHRIPRPVKIVMGAPLLQELGHADMQIPVGAKKGGDRELGENDNGYTEQDGTAQEYFVTHI